MSIGFLIEPREWDGHKKQVKRACGTVCYGALAAHFGTESSKVLEWRADRREPYDSSGDPSVSNKYLRWRQGKALPNDESVAHIHGRTAGAVQLDVWRDLPLWELLDAQAPPMSRLLRIIEQSPVNIRRILFGDAQADQQGRFHHYSPTRSQILGIRNLHSLDAFITLLCLARKGEVLEDDPLHFLPSACAFDIFPRILYSYAPLRYRWEELFACIERLYWNRLYLGGAYFKFPRDVVHESLTLLNASPNASLRGMSGKRLRPVRKDIL